MSTGMEAGHFRSGSTDIQIESKTSEMEGQGKRNNLEGRHMGGESDRSKDEMITLLRIYQT